MGLQKWKARRPGAKAWDKLQARDSSETLAHRDVYEDQQLDRADIEPKKTATVGRIIAVTLGAIVAFIIWMLISIIALLVDSAITAVGGLGGDAGAQTYYTESMTVNESGEPETCYQGVDENGMVDGGPCYSSPDDVPVPDWYTSRADSAEDEASSEAETPSTMGDYVLHVSFFKSFLSLGGGTLIAVIFGTWVSRRVAAANLMRDTSDIKQHRNDQHIALPEEVQRTYDVFPDAGAHSSVEVSSLLSHTMLMRKGLPQVAVTKRADKDIIDEDGEIVHYAGEPILDENGDEIIETKPIIDEAFGKALFEASGLDNAGLQKLWDARTIPYNADGKDRDKLGKHKTVADLIKADWVFPDYERQRPAGVYNVDTAPVNTMVLAITRAGKGQTYIEPLIDMWSRERKPSNMVINDPKGELLVKFYVPLVTRGFNPVQFNLINAPNTDIYNPLGMAAEAAREGDSMKCAQYVENMADVFFPVDGSEDPVWPTAANNAFKRTAYGLIDFYLEEERELREYAALTQMDPATLEKRIDDLWGHVTLYNCYQLFVTLTSKKKDNPEAVLEKKIKAGEFGDDQMAFEQAKEQAQREAFLWEGKAELDMLTLFFNATDALPTNSMRTLVGNADKSLRAMAGAEKMLASVYGIAITAMNYFTDPTISRLTSGKPSQNTDLAGLSFPRRIGVRFAANYIKRENFNGKRAVWSAFADPEFTQDLGPDFEHADLINPEGWARYYFKGIFPDEQAWIKLEIVDPKTKMLMRSFYFHFKKNYQLTLNARHYVVEPVTNQKIVKNGVLRELKRSVDDDGTVRFTPGETQFKQDRLDLTSAGLPERIEGHARAIMQSSVRYSEAPTALFLITPPHLGKYAKLLLILIKQLVDLNFEQSYMTKSNQKPLYRTRFMFDELGNLRSDGQGISGFETMLSIGLGQEQQFTLILQTLQQLRDVYGESVDKIVQGNAQPLTAKIATPNGWTTMGQLKLGDEVLLPRGGSAPVSGIYPRGRRKVYRITRRDGSQTLACNEHLWEVVIRPPQK